MDIDLQTDHAGSALSQPALMPPRPGSQRATADGSAAPVEISVVMPCLNEEASIGCCVDKAHEGIRRTQLRGEVIVCDNGSTDRSAQIAAEHGARVVYQPKRGYGNAYLKGFEAARGRYLVMGDADDSYDFTEIDRLVKPLTRGYEYVLGSRFRGDIRPGAMPWLHRYIGNPVLTWILNRLFGLNASDAHSGMRAFTRDAYERMRLQTAGMEFASEIVVSAARSHLKTSEVPITYHPRAGASKLHSFQDGWRHLRFMLLHSPDHLFLLPGVILLLLGLLGMLWLLPGPQRVGSRMVDIHVMVLCALLVMLGAQAVTMGLCAKAYAFTHHYARSDALIERFYRHFSLERGLLLALVVGALGFLVDLYVLAVWLLWLGDPRTVPDVVLPAAGALDAVRPALFGSTIIALGAQVALGSCLLAILQIDTAE